MTRALSIAARPAFASLNVYTCPFRTQPLWPRTQRWESIAVPVPTMGESITEGTVQTWKRSTLTQLRLVVQ